MRVAICFAGLPYFIRQNKDYWLDTIHEYNADVYASLWDEEEVYQQGDTIQYFKEVYKPVSLEVESQKALLSSFRFLAEEYGRPPSFLSEHDHFAHANARAYASYYKIWRANLLPHLIGKHYDVVVRAETCSSYPDLKIVKENALSAPYWHHIFNYGGYDSTSLNNWVAFGPPDIMDYYCSCFLKLRKYYEECFIQPTESFLTHHLLQRPNIRLRLFFNKIYRKAVLNWDGRDSEGETPGSSYGWYYDQVSDSDLTNPSIEAAKDKIIKEELDLHEMMGPVHKLWPRQSYQDEESAYHSVHKFSPENKAKSDSNCDKALLDKHGNWIPIINWDDVDSTKIQKRNPNYVPDENLSNSDWLLALYHNMLKTNINKDSEGYKYWMDELANKRSRADIKRYFRHTAEEENKNLFKKV